MKAQFKIVAPDTVDVSLTLVEDVAGWRQLYNALVSVEDNGKQHPTLVEFARKIVPLIEQSQKVLAAQYWTTGYSTERVKEGEA